MNKAVGNLAAFFFREAQPQLICLFTVHAAVRASPWGFLTRRHRRWCVFQGRSGRMCRGAEVTRDGARASACPSRENGTGRVPTRGGGLCPLSLADLYLGLFPTRAGRRLAVPAPGSAFCGNGESEALLTRRAGSWQARAWRLLVSSVRRLITAVNCRSQGRGPAGAPPSLHSLLPPSPRTRLRFRRGAPPVSVPSACLPSLSVFTINSAVSRVCFCNLRVGRGGRRARARGACTCLCCSPAV